MRQFVDFAYGNRRKDKSKVLEIMDAINSEYDPAKDRYKKFRETLEAYEKGNLSDAEFLSLYSRVSSRKSEAFKIMAKNYMEMKEDNGLSWDGFTRVDVEFSGLFVQVTWSLHTLTANSYRIVGINFGKDPYPKDKERAVLTLLQMAVPESYGVGIMNLQASTLVVKTRVDDLEKKFLDDRAKKFLDLAK
ncbi:hypothetical protein [Pannonibacter indicus]|uniref:hypothetical protein n=1 Tax=Pannonibacter indicus TaxID=466044 RepID=UPI0035AF6C48